MSDLMGPVVGDYEGVVRVQALPPQGMVTLRGDLADPSLRDVVARVAGVAVPLTRRADFSGTRGVLWMSCDELLLACPYAEAAGLATQMAADLSGTHALVADVSDARAVFVLTGAGVRDVIAKLAPVDMAVGAFGAGDFRRTRFGQVAAAFWMVSDNEVRLICFRSVAEYMFGMLCHAADPDGAISVL